MFLAAYYLVLNDDIQKGVVGIPRSLYYCGHSVKKNTNVLAAALTASDIALFSSVTDTLVWPNRTIYNEPSYSR